MEHVEHHVIMMDSKELINVGIQLMQTMMLLSGDKFMDAVQQLMIIVNVPQIKVGSQVTKQLILFVSQLLLFLENKVQALMKTNAGWQKQVLRQLTTNSQMMTQLTFIPSKLQILDLSKDVNSHCYQQEAVTVFVMKRKVTSNLSQMEKEDLLLGQPLQMPIALKLLIFQENKKAQTHLMISMMNVGQ